MIEERRAAALFYHGYFCVLWWFEVWQQRVACLLNNRQRLVRQNGKKHGCAVFFPICRPMCRFFRKCRPVHARHSHDATSRHDDFGQTLETDGGSGGRDGSLLRRLGRRHATGRHAIDQHVGNVRKRRGHFSRLSGRNSGSAWNARGRERLSDSLCQPQDLHAGRSGRRPGRHEPGGPGDQSRRSGTRRRADRQQRELRPARSEIGGLRGQSARKRQPGGLPAVRGRDDQADPSGRRGPRVGHERGGSLPELLRDGPGLLALRSAVGADRAFHYRQVRQAAESGRGQPPRVASRLSLRRNDRGDGRSLFGRPGATAAGRVSQHHGQSGPGVGTDGGLEAQRLPVVPGQLSDHACQRHPPRVGPA